MIKQGLLLVLLTGVAIVFKSQIDIVLNMTVSVHDHMIRYLSMVFAGDSMGKMIQAILALLLIPAVIALLVSTTYWFARRAMMPYTMHVVWVSWLILLTTFTLKGV